MERSENQKTENILTAVTRLLIAILLILLVIFLYGTMSTGWFAMNKKVDGSGMGVQAANTHLGPIKITSMEVSRPSVRSGNAPYIFSRTPGADGVFADGDILMPGDSITVTAEFATLDAGNEKIPVEFLLRAPAGEANADVGVVSDTTNYHYLSRNLQLKGLMLREKTGSTLKDHPVVKKLKFDGTEYITDGGPADLTQLTAVPDKLLAEAKGDWGLAGRKTYVLTLEFLFENSATVNQTLLRGDPTLAKVVPSRFVREIVVNEALN